MSWPVDENCGCRFSDLFDNKIAEVSQEDSLRLSGEGLSGLRQLEAINSAGGKFRSLNSPGPMFPGRGNIIDFEYERIPLGVREDVLKYVRKLTPINDIIEGLKFAKSLTAPACLLI